MCNFLIDTDTACDDAELEIPVIRQGRPNQLSDCDLYATSVRLDTPMEFEWDGAKSDQNLRQRGFGFDYATCVFDGPTIETVDDRRAYEIRIRAIGQVDENVIVVIYTDRDEIRRIISARKANRRERQRWQTFVNP